MATVAKRLFDTTQLTAAAATYYTAPSLTHTILKKLTFTNSDPVNAFTVTLHLIKSGGAATASNIIINARPVAAGETLEAFEAEGHVLDPGDFIQAFASSAAEIVFAGSGIEIT